MAGKSFVQKPKGSKVLPARSDEWNPFLSLRGEMDKVFDSFFHDFQMEPFERFSNTFQPNIDVSDHGKEIRISAELPGMDEKDIELSLTRDSLTIKGEKLGEMEEKGKSFHRVERIYGSFTRTIPLPVEVNTDKAEAFYKNGVLTVSLPKTEKAISETKRIPIKAKKTET